MKNYLKCFIAVLIIPLIISACSSSDDENPGAALIGTWSITSFVTSGCTDPDDNGDEICTPSCGTLVFTETTVTFNFTDGTSEPAETYTVTGNTITATDGGDTETLTFAVSGTALTITTPSDGGCSNITNLTKV